MLENFLLVLISEINICLPFSFNYNDSYFEQVFIKLWYSEELDKNRIYYQLLTFTTPTLTNFLIWVKWTC
jgi:hypothetical protein